MDEAAREVLKKLKGEIKKNLNLDDDILDTLEADDTLNIDLVQKVKAEKTNSEKISLLLFILQKKGPNAFTAFINAISPAYKFLADMLIERYHEEVKRLDRDSGNSSEESLEHNENTKPKENAETEETGAISSTTELKISLPSVGHHNTQPFHRNTLSDQLQSHLNHEHHSPRRHTNISSEFAIHPTNHFLHTSHASRRSSHSIDFATHQSLNGMYTKLKMHLFHMNEREQSFSSPEPVTFEKVEELLDKLLKLEQDCTKAIGATSKDSLLTNIINLKLLKADLQKNLNKKEEQVQKYAIKILKLETKCKNNEMTLNQQQKMIETLKLENERLNDENGKLKEDLYHQEQTKQTENENKNSGRKLKEMHRLNEELRSKIAWYEKELDIMRQKVTVLSYKTQDQSSVESKDIAGMEVENVKKKETVTVTKSKVPGINQQPKSTTSIINECKNWSTGTNSRSSSSLQHMKSKILFAESKRTESKTYTDTSFLDRDVRTEQQQKLEQNHDEPPDLRTQQYDPVTPFESMAKLSANKQSVPQSALMKQKTLLQVKKPLAHKSLKKNPKWVRKPLR